jgi:hypothetical protein
MMRRRLSRSLSITSSDPSHVTSRPWTPLLLLALAACEREADTISRDRFVAANVALRTLPGDVSDSARAAVLARYRVDADDLAAWVEANARRPDVLAEAWKAVAHRVDSLAVLRDTPPGMEGPDGMIDEPPPPDPASAPPPGGEKPPLELREIAEELGVPRPPHPAGARDEGRIPPPRPRPDRPGPDRTAPPVVIEPVEPDAP